MNRVRNPPMNDPAMPSAMSIKTPYPEPFKIFPVAQPAIRPNNCPPNGLHWPPRLNECCEPAATSSLRRLISNGNWSQPRTWYIYSPQRFACLYCTAHVLGLISSPRFSEGDS